uniref:Uncharacterized protein n=1 Tax=Candidatus Methanophaga sp. ANME-1 ERB7 TaxID=2759913 RepID=A0A7G9Z282_9EURY|nr:hypothetical protein DIMBOPOO_00039 [Methanosarcinales archaeon ANME-1 ERB7]
MAVVVGVIIGFGLNFLKENIHEKQQKGKYLKDLLADLEYNKRLAEEGRGWGYHTLGYIDAKGAKYLFDLPEKLRTQIYDVQSRASAINEGITVFFGQKFEDVGDVLNREMLKSLLEEVIPEFKKYLGNKK